MKISKKKKLTVLISFVCVFAFLIGAFTVWSVGTAYKPTKEALRALENSGDIKVTSEKFGYFFDGEGTDTALIFYPGARVEYTCYAPLLTLLAQEGIDCFAVKMPFNLAFFGMNAADSIMELYDYESWYISGHSLGGAMAASYASGNADKLDGAVLFAAYPTSSLDFEGFTVISMYGSEDGVLNMEKLEKGRDFMPQTYYEVCIEGGNHAGFGTYGEQKGDGEAAISAKEQQEEAVRIISDVVLW